MVVNAFSFHLININKIINNIIIRICNRIDNSVKGYSPAAFPMIKPNWLILVSFMSTKRLTMNIIPKVKTKRESLSN